jgi:hypothetical protein
MTCREGGWISLPLQAGRSPPGGRHCGEQTGWRPRGRGAAGAVKDQFEEPGPLCCTKEVGTGGSAQRRQQVGHVAFLEEELSAWILDES